MCNEEITIRIEEVTPVEIGVKLDIAYAEDPTLVSRLDELNGEVIGVTSSAKIAAAINSKEAIAESVNGKGGNITADTPLSDYAEEIQAIPVSVVGKPSDGSRVRFFDYDGTLLKTEYVPKGGAATAPEIPQHERLLFQEWNNDFDNITRDKDVGAIYTTKSGASEFDLIFGAKDSLTLDFTCTVDSGELVIDWGDGSAQETAATVGGRTFSHTYPDCGEYAIKVWGDWTPPEEGRIAGAFSNELCKRVFIAGFGGKPVYRTNFSPRLEILTIPEGISAVSCYIGTAKISNLKCFIQPRSATASDGNMTGHAGVYIMSDTASKAPSGTHIIPVIYLGDNITTVSISSFNNVLLDTLCIPPKVTSMTFSAQAQVSELIILAEKLTQLNIVYTNVDVLRKITIHTKVPPSLTGSFSGINPCYIYVPKGCAEAYKSATNWSKFADIIKEMEND